MRAVIIDIGQRKDLREILGQDILDYQLEWLKADTQIEDVIILTDSITVAKKQKKVSYYACPELPKYEFLKSILNDQPFLLLYGPILSAFPVRALREHFWLNKADISCLTGGYFQGETLTIEQDGIHKLLSVFGTGDSVNNAYIINPLILTYYFHERFDIQLFLTDMLKHSRKIFCLNNPDWVEYVNNYTAYFQTTNYFLELSNVQGTKIHNSYYGDNCEIDFSVELYGRQFFGKDCRVGQHSVLKNSVFLDSVTIGTDSRVSNSILQKRVKIGQHCELEHCLLGENCTVGDNVRLPAGTILAADSVVQSNSGVLDAV
jgi:NDP-sugar pyrophosphorylase family protein